MSFYEELLTLGQHLHDFQRAALYKFLLEFNNNRYTRDAHELLREGTLKSKIRNGEIIYTVTNNQATYAAQKIGTDEIYENVREMDLGLFPFLKIHRLKQFMAQAEVEVIWNFPLAGVNTQNGTGYTTISYPFSDLRYFSNGRGRILGLINKVKRDDSELMRKLRAS